MANVKNVYLVDYENVHEAGLEGSKELTDNDMVVLLTTQPRASVSIETLSRFNPVELQCFVIPKGNQAVDLCLSYKLGRLREKYKDDKINFVIISKDKGYDRVIRFCSEESTGSFSRRETISERK